MQVKSDGSCVISIHFTPNSITKSHYFLLSYLPPIIFIINYSANYLMNYFFYKMSEN